MSDPARRPSSVRFVYNWNIRELSNLFQGLTMSGAAEFQTPTSFIKYWLHEARGTL